MIAIVSNDERSSAIVWKQASFSDRAIQIFPQCIDQTVEAQYKDSGRVLVVVVVVHC